MGSRLRTDPDSIYQLFVEVVEIHGGQSHVRQQYPPHNVDNELLKSVVQFSFPASESFVSVSVENFTFTLTDISGQFRFGFCRLSPGTKRCLCIVSYFPWFEIFYRLLNHFAELLNQGKTVAVQSLLVELYMSRVPRQGMFVELQVDSEDTGFSFTCPPDDDLPSIPESRNLTEYCNAVNLHNMIAMFASMLFERRIIVTSKRLSRLTSCIHAAAALIYPMNWQHLYIPALPVHLLEYCSAPMPYLIGVHSSLMHKARNTDVGDAVILDADEDTVTSQYDDVHALPLNVLYLLKKNLKVSSSDKSLSASLLGNGLSHAFLAAMVCLLGGYRDALRFCPGRSVEFDTETFIASRPATMRPFLLTLLHLQAFEQFIGDRLDMLNSGRGFKGLFESEASSCMDRMDSQGRYKEWIKRKGKLFKQESKEMWSEVKDQSKRKMTDIRSYLKDLKKPEMVRNTFVLYAQQQQLETISPSHSDVRALRPSHPSNLDAVLGPSPLPRQLPVRRESKYKVVDLVSTHGTITGRSQTLTHATGPVERFHSVRKALSYDNTATHANTSSSDSGLFTGDDVEIYSNWSPRRLSSVQDVTVSDEDISSTSDRWDDSSVSSSKQLALSADDLLSLQMSTYLTLSSSARSAQSLPVRRSPAAPDVHKVCQPPRRKRRLCVRPVSCESTSTTVVPDCGYVDSPSASGVDSVHNCSSDALHNESGGVQLQSGAVRTDDADSSARVRRHGRPSELPRTGSNITRKKAFYNIDRPSSIVRRDSTSSTSDECPSTS